MCSAIRTSSSIGPPASPGRPDCIVRGGLLPEEWLARSDQALQRSIGGRQGRLPQGDQFKSGARVSPRSRAARLPRNLLQRGQVLLAQAVNLAGDADGALLEEHGQEDAGGEIRP